MEPIFTNFKGTKNVMACCMTKPEAEEYLGRKIPDAANGETLGFLVKYEDGYMSWSPHDAFIKAYKHSHDESGWIGRVKNEAAELRTKKNALRDFILTDEYAQLDQMSQILLFRQHDQMSAYLETLRLRIDYEEQKREAAKVSGA